MTPNCLDVDSEYSAYTELMPSVNEVFTLLSVDNMTPNCLDVDSEYSA